MKSSSWILCLIFLSVGSVAAIAARQTGSDLWINRILAGEATLSYSGNDIKNSVLDSPVENPDSGEWERSTGSHSNDSFNPNAKQPGSLSNKQEVLSCNCIECSKGNSKNCTNKSKKKSRFEDRYWLGVQVGEPAEETLNQLSLRCGQIVGYIIPDSPAAGIFKEHDVIVRFNGKQVGCNNTLGKLIQENRDNEAVVDVYRKSKPIQLKLKPRKITISRFTERKQSDFVTNDDDSIAASLDFTELEPGQQKQFLVYMVRQPLILPGDSAGKKKSQSKKEKDRLNLESVVSFHRSEDGKPYVVVHQGNKKEEYYEQDFPQLPSSVRKLIQFVELTP